MLSQNFDISVIFVDAFLKLVKVEPEATEEFFARLEELGIQDGDTVDIYDIEFEYQR